MLLVIVARSVFCEFVLMSVVYLLFSCNMVAFMLRGGSGFIRSGCSGLFDNLVFSFS